MKRVREEEKVVVWRKRKVENGRPPFDLPVPGQHRRAARARLSHTTTHEKRGGGQGSSAEPKACRDWPLPLSRRL